MNRIQSYSRLRRELPVFILPKASFPCLWTLLKPMGLVMLIRP